MTREFVERHRKTPSALAFMPRAFLPSPGLPPGAALPRITQRWDGLHIDAGHLKAFCRATGLPEHGYAPIIYPHVIGFRLQMALLTHRAFPLPVWIALQIRNRLVQHRHLRVGERFDLETHIGTNRIVDKGTEIDLVSRLMHETNCCWESEVTYFFRGRFGSPADVSSAAAPDLAHAPVVDRFTIPSDGGWNFGVLTGDYNGIHWSNWYARRFGFRAAFPHPQRVAGICLGRLEGPQSEAQTLQIWIKGPLFYGSAVALSAATEPGGTRFGVCLESDHRFALSGQWRAGDAVQ